MPAPTAVPATKTLAERTLPGSCRYLPLSILMLLKTRSVDRLDAILSSLGVAFDGGGARRERVAGRRGGMLRRPTSRDEDDEHIDEHIHEHIRRKNELLGYEAVALWRASFLNAGPVSRCGRKKYFDDDKRGRSNRVRGATGLGF